jgi:hypothetical protein
LLCIVTYLVALTWTPIYTRPKGSCHFLLFWKHVCAVTFTLCCTLFELLFNVEGSCCYMRCAITFLTWFVHCHFELLFAMPLQSVVSIAFSTCYMSKHWMTIEKQQKNCWNTWGFLNCECSQYVKGNEMGFEVTLSGW